jgi:flagellar biogenesis protein FliO
MCNQGKKIGFLCVLLVVSGGWIALASRQGGDVAGLKTENGGQKTEDAARSTDPIRHPSFLSDPNLPSSQGISLGNGELFLRMMLSVGLVIGLGAVALYLSRKVLPRAAHAPGKEIHILETAYLGPRKALHLVEVGNQRLLIASTNDSVTMLAPVTEGWLDMAKPELGEAVKA